MTDKKCGKCKKVKSADLFGSRSASKDGKAAQCKDCQRAYDRGRANLPHRVKARLDYSKTEDGIVSASKAKKAWADRNLVKRAANVIVGNAVRGGKLIKPSSCEGCESTPVRLHGHHDDYAYPLVVRWLCPGCHNKWHKANGPGLNA